MPRHRRGRDVDVPWRRVAAPPRLPRGYSVETPDAAAATRTTGLGTGRRAQGEYKVFAANLCGIVYLDFAPTACGAGESECLCMQSDFVCCGEAGGAEINKRPRA